MSSVGCKEWLGFGSLGVMLLYVWCVIAHIIQWFELILIGSIRYLLGMGWGLPFSMMVGKYPTFLSVTVWLQLGSQCAKPKFMRLSLYHCLLGHLNRSSLVMGVSPMSGWGLWGVFQCLYASS